MRSPEIQVRTQRVWAANTAPILVLPMLALAIVWPLLRHGPSCGHDFGFHLQSWMDAGAQMRRGAWLPRWAYSPAFNAGEPRFVFYPPLSWWIGSLLLLALPAAIVPAVFTWLALTGAAIGMYALARRFAGKAAALLAAAVYVANPYILFTAFERTAYAELLAAAWMPLLFRAALSEELRPVPVAIPLALLWLTNAPAAVMGTYALILIVALRVLRLLLGLERIRLAGKMTSAAAGRFVLKLCLGLGFGLGLGLSLGLGLAGFYLLPAAFERRYVQIAMAIIPNMRVEDNFLFGSTGYGPHDAVLHTASLVAVETTGLALLFLGIAFAVRERGEAGPGSREGTGRRLLPILGALLAVIASLLWKGSLPVWHHVPELAFLQFPWRLLSVLGCVLGLAAASALRSLILPVPWAAAAALTIAVAGGAVGIVPFREACEAGELPAARLARFETHHGVGPTDEYTPEDADNDQLRWDDPAWWLAATPNAPGPGTVPNPAATITDYDEPPPMDQTVAGFAPHQLTLRLDRPEDLILNLRDYPAWQVTVNGHLQAKHLERDDGLLGLALPAGQNTVNVRWRTLPDAWAGEALTTVSLIGAGWLAWRSRRIRDLSDAS